MFAVPSSLRLQVKPRCSEVCLSHVNGTARNLAWSANGLLLLLASVATAQTSLLDEARDLHRAAQFEAALAGYRAVIAGDAPVADRATAANNACVILLNDEQLDEALELCELARSLRLDIGDDQRLARTLNNLGAVQEASGDYAAAASTYAQALAINAGLGDIASATVNQANLGVLAMQRGLYGEALSRFDAVERQAARHSGEPWARQQQIFAGINRGVVFERVGAYREALDAYRSVPDDELDARRAADLTINIGVAYRNLGDPVRALSMFEQASQQYTAAGIRGELPALWLDRGLVHHLNLSQPAAARDAYERALALASASGLADEQLQALYYLGRLALDTGDLKSAQSSLDSALQMARNSASLEGQWSALEGLARLELARDELATADAHLGEAIDLIESARADIAVRDVRQRFFGSRRAVYDLQVEAAWRRFRSTGDRSFIDLAFLAAQAAKARELSTGTADAFEVSDLQFITDSLQQPLVEFYFGENDLFAWYVDGDQLEFERVAPAAAVRSAAIMAYEEIRTGSPAEQTATLTQLLAPALTWLQAGSQVYLAPDGPLFFIPFELLSVGDHDLLLDDRQIAYYPSAAVAVSVAGRQAGQRRLTLAVVGPPPGAMTIVINGIETALPALPDAQRETESLHRRLPGSHRVLQGAEATPEALVQMLRGGADIAHFSTHAVLDNRFGPAIVLSGKANSEALLTAETVASAGPFDIGLTVLAACRSGLGGIEDGYAINSLGGAWLAAGSDAIVATLWEVSDRYTHVFMQRFYGHLARGARPAAALAATKREFHRQAPANTTWAAYVLIGDADALFDAGPRYWLAVAGLILAGMSVLLWRRIRE